MPDNLNRFGAVEALNTIKSAEFTSEQLIQSCLDRISQRNGAVNAWEYLDEETALQQARALDQQKKGGPMHGVPVGIKDIIDTDDMPTGHGSPIYAGRIPGKNAACIDRLKAAGAIILGKTVTTEFAYLQPGKTRHPQDRQHTPGGSSSGSAAAVADYQVPLSLGTQTAGSIIRPASFCGVVGYKPTFNSFPIVGVHAFAPSLDTLGGFARSMADIVLLRKVLADNHVNIVAHQPEKIALVQGPYWQNAEDETRLMFEHLEGILSYSDIEFRKIDLSEDFIGINDAQYKIQVYECTDTLRDYYLNHKEDLSDRLREDYEHGLSLAKEEMKLAYTLVKKCKDLLAQVFSQYQIILTPASRGRAPEGIENTGDPVFNRMWTALGVPCISLPFPQNEKELPLGLQLVGPVNGDADLLSYASCLEALLKASTD